MLLPVAIAVARLAALDSLHGSAQRGGDVAGAKLTLSATAPLTVVIENLRDVAIEAIGVAEVDAGGRPLRQQTHDFCLSDPADRTPGRGRIQPHERREFPVAAPTDGPPPKYVLSFVLFDDLSFEGSAGAHDELLRARTDRAFEYDFTLQGLKAVPTLSVRGIEGFLNGRKEEWTRQLREQGRPLEAGGPLDDALRQAHESPERFMAGIEAYRGRVEGQLARLRRHLPPGGIAGARLTIVNTSARRLTVTIENHRDSPLIEWSIDSPWVRHAGQDVVAPHQRRDVSIEMQDDRPANRPTTLDYAAFEDGYYEGRGPGFDRWVAMRNERREDLAYWVTVFASLPRVSEAELRKVLSDHVAARSSGETHMTIRHVSDRVQELMAWFPQASDIWARVDHLGRQVESEYRAITRVPSGKQPGAVDAVTAATVASVDVRPAVSYTVIIENLRDVPIEAFGVADFNLATGQFSGWTGSDFSKGDPTLDRAGSGRIMPHERRDLGSIFGPQLTVPLATLYFVMFEDLQFEGAPVERVRLLRIREAQADEHVAALAALDEAAGKPASELEAFFAARREVYIKQLQGQGRIPPPGAALEGFVRTIRLTSAERFAAEIPATRQRIERDIARLRRHLQEASK